MAIEATPRAAVSEAALAGGAGGRGGAPEQRAVLSRRSGPRRSDEIASAQLLLAEERERIGIALRTGTMYQLSSVAMKLKGMAAEAQEPRLRDRLNLAVEELDGAIRDLRKSIFNS
jgi:signal transduction histidine kinase